MNNLEKISDKELYSECKKWGLQSIEAKYKFEGLIPEVNKRKLYERRGFPTIYDFARILGGLSRDQVNRVFSVNRKLENKPVLQKLFTEGAVSVNKLCRITSIATPENQEQIAKDVTILSQKALEIKVREIRNSAPQPQVEIFQAQNGYTKSSEDVRAHKPNINRDIKLMQTLSEEMKEKLMELVEKGHDLNRILNDLLEKREQKIEQKMAELSKKQTTKESAKVPTRHIPTAIQKTIKEKYGNKCSKSNCNKPAKQLHHEKPFAKWHSHNPEHIKPLCRGHHELAHVEKIEWSG